MRDRSAALQWRSKGRVESLRVFADHAATLSWNRSLLLALLDELHVDDLFDELLGKPRRLPKRRYPQALAVAIALRHSWRADDLAAIGKRLGLRGLRKKRKSPG